MVLVHKAHKLPSEDGEYEPLAAPVAGYRASKKELVMSVEMRRADLLGDPKNEPDGVSIELRGWRSGEWASNPSLRHRPVVEVDTLAVRRSSPLEVAEAMAELQQFDMAIVWAKRALEASHDAYSRAAALYTMATNYRRRGYLEQAHSAFAKALELLQRQGDEEDGRVSILGWEIRFARVSLDLLRDAGPIEALRKLDALEQEVKEEGVDKLLGAELPLSEARLSRERGGMHLACGEYAEAGEHYRKAFSGFGWESGLERALSRAGSAHAALLLGNYSKASRHLREVGAYLRRHPNSRVRWRYLRFACEFKQLQRLGITRVDSDRHIRAPEVKLRKLAEVGTFRIERIYAMLTLGALALHDRPDYARKRFLEAEELAKSAQSDRAGVARADRMPLERHHAMLGCAEAHRLAGDRECAEAIYDRLLKFYEEHGILWGAERTRLSQALCASRERLPDQHDGPGQALVRGLTSERLPKTTSVFICIP
jgi:tetratricopeptide (TPR) repeat protein